MLVALRRVLVATSLAAVSIACTTPRSSVVAVASPALQPDLNVVQLQCRDEKHGDVATWSAALGRNCAEDTTQLVLSTLDLGSLTGFNEADHEVSALAELCVCGATRCSSADADHAVQNASAVLSEGGLAERNRTIARILDASASSCVNAAVDVDIFKSGYDCGYLAGLHSDLLHREVRERLAAALGGHDAGIDTRTADCLRELGGPPSAPMSR
jgi:hypothetical protein